MRVLVTGGTGVVGGAVVRELARRGHSVTFTCNQHVQAGHALAEATGQHVRVVDLRSRGAIARLAGEGAPDALVHAAGVGHRTSLEDISAEAWHYVFAVNVEAPFLLCQAFAPAWKERGADAPYPRVVLVGALDRAQSLPLPVHFAASQGALSALTMALARELGPRGVRVNMVALGPLGSGLSRILGEAELRAYQTFSALRRLGTAEEAARALAWLVEEPGFLTGKVVPVNGGL